MNENVKELIESLPNEGADCNGLGASLNQKVLLTEQEKSMDYYLSCSQ